MSALTSSISSSPGRQAEREVLFLLQMGQQRLVMFNDLAKSC